MSINVECDSTYFCTTDEKLNLQIVIMALHDLPSNKPLSTTGGSFFALIFLLVHHSNLRVFVTVSSFYGPTWLLFSFPNAGVMYKFNLLSYSHSNLPYKTPCRYFYDFFAHLPLHAKGFFSWEKVVKYRAPGENVQS